MTAFIDSLLEPGEDVRSRAKVHPVVLVPGIAALVVGLWLWPFLLVAALALADAAIRLTCTELAVTSRRVIVKRGFVRRTTIEIPLSAIESIVVEQDPAARLVGAGTIHVRGIGGTIAPIRWIASPFSFRTAVVLERRG